MSRMNRTWMAMVAAALLLATLAGVVWARPNQSPQPADIVRKVTVPAASFNPREDGANWHNDGIRLAMDSGSATFIAPVVFPCLSAVTVKKITLSATDLNSGATACVGMYRASPKSLTEAKMAEVCTSDTVGQTSWDDNSITNAQVWPSHGPYLWLTVYGTDIAVYGVTIEYQRNI